MNRRTSKVFELLDLNPNEEFYIVNSTYKYRITEDMKMQKSVDSIHWEDATNQLSDVLTSKVRITKDHNVWAVQSFVNNRDDLSSSVEGITFRRYSTR